MTHADRRERRRKIARAVKNGSGTLETLSSVGREFGVKPWFVKSCCKEFGVRYECGWSTPSDKTLDIIARLTVTTDPYSDIARDFGITKQWVFDIACRCRKQGMEIPPRPRRGRPRKMVG